MRRLIFPALLIAVPLLVIDAQPASAVVGGMVIGMVLTAMPRTDRSIDAPTPIGAPMLMAVGVAGVGGAGGGGSREHAVAPRSRG